MCRFCAQHGDGKAWYLEASSYAADLGSDLRRRDYLRHFISDFDRSRSFVITATDTLRRLPRPLRLLGTNVISRNLQANHFGQPVPIEDCGRIFEMATSIVRLPCLCRTHAGHAPEGVCLAVTTRPIDDLLASSFSAAPAFADGPDVTRFDRLTREQALEVLRSCETRGLMHSVWTFITPWIGAICNCDLPSGCMAMRLQLECGVRIMWKGENLAEIDADKCTGCAACVGSCPFTALSYDPTRHRAVLDATRCYGCGTCRASCRAGALSLADRRSRIGTVLEPAQAW